MPFTHLPTLLAEALSARGYEAPTPVQAAVIQPEAEGRDVIVSAQTGSGKTVAFGLAIAPQLLTRMNLEAAVTQEMIDFACRIKPADVCLVPEKRTEVTTEGGLDVVRYFKEVQAAVKQLQGEGIRVSLFIDADEQQIAAAAELGAPVIELHTGRYADTDGAEQLAELERIKAGVLFGVGRGLKVNAGHGLHYTNVQAIAAIPDITELNIGHAIVAHAVFVGWENAVREMKAIMVSTRLGRTL